MILVYALYLTSVCQLFASNKTQARLMSGWWAVKEIQ